MGNMSRTINSSIDGTIDDAEIAAFDTSEYWDERGAARWLIKYNPVRVADMRDAACRRFARDPAQTNCLQGLRILEVGCGGGVFCEPLAQLGASVVGIDPAQTAIEMATEHARATGARIDYRCTTAEGLAASGERFDVVLAMEVVEHVSDVDVFIRQCAALVKPGGLAILSTISRTFKSYVSAIVFAEYILRLLPLGSHQWRKFRTPDEIRSAMEKNGLQFDNVTGVNMNLMARAFQLTNDTSVNYMLTAFRPEN